eukprot:CAMPEP_0181326242 /NCGR_PEP_ID=MMETSP1101-20121128/21380_1 /TAXON_ID=46948 /ORGANISM="Rhodomonas abbreviata, Strain Caron Lab Isolate" /LENGTH=147 /DNA_ID=CAMNT_0023434655 /DNA_START=121 /DNA_END=564 /DNA_ORIENTATION=+
MRRISKELATIQEHASPHFYAAPVADDLFLWKATLKGPERSPYAGGSFLLNIRLPASYPMLPPKVEFVTKIYHPNVNARGGISLDVLQDRWSPALTIERVLEAIYWLLLDPNPDDPEDAEIGRVCITDPVLFQVTAREWSVKYAGAV